MPLSELYVTAASREVRAGQLALELVFETGSTNADLLSRVPHLVQPTVRVAEVQTAGRGRAGRRWVSAPGEALTFSLAWRFQRDMAALLGLPLAVGVVVAECLREHGVAVHLKWPNDVLKDGAKLAGILLETAPDGQAHGGQRGNWAVIGIGINIGPPPEDVRALGGQAAGFGAEQRVDRNRLLATLLDRLALALRVFEESGLDTFLDRWNALHAWQGEPVAVLDHGTVRHAGRALGIDRQGRLRLQTPQGEIAVVAGDISLRQRNEAD